MNRRKRSFVDNLISERVDFKSKLVRQGEKAIIYYRKINQDDIIIEIHALNVAALFHEIRQQ